MYVFVSGVERERERESEYNNYIIFEFNSKTHTKPQIKATTNLFERSIKGCMSKRRKKHTQI